MVRVDDACLSHFLQDVLMHISIIGSGAWGTALALNFLRSDKHKITLWTRFEDHAKQMSEEGENKLYLAGFPLPQNNQNFKISSVANDLRSSDLIIWTVPTQFSVDLAQLLVKNIDPTTSIMIASKGILTTPFEDEIFLSNVLEKIFGKRREYYILSGPNLAREVALHLPTATVLSGRTLDKTKNLAHQLWHEHFRMYVNTDPIGTQIGGALKNVYAIGAGMVMGKMLGQNALASYLIRAYAEMRRFCSHWGGLNETLSGLSGMGDLILTASSLSSRNTSLGKSLSEGQPLQTILASRTSVSEGVYTTQAVHDIAKKNKIRLPICDIIYQILYQSLAVGTAIEQIVSNAPHCLEEFDAKDFLV